MLREIEYPASHRYKSKTENEPLLFFLEHFYHSKKLRFHLGFFSTKVFKTIANGFAYFINNGGQIELLINHFLTKADKEFLSREEHLNIPSDADDLEIIKFLFDNLEENGKHFEKCLSYLLQNGQLQLKIIKPKGSDGYEHTKEGVFSDGKDKVYFNGSANFTAAALLSNSENVNADPGWVSEISTSRIADFEAEFERIWQEKDCDYDYLSPKQSEVISSHIKQKYPSIEVDVLLKESLITGKEISGNKKINDLQSKLEHEILGDLGLPRFPYSSGPREYQKEAYKNWIQNNYSGVFAMATGTGKTITSLNCLLCEYQKINSYKAIILVPSITLLNQWEQEVENFNFRKILKVGGGSNWESHLANYVSNFTWGIKDDIIIISTYGSFITDRFQKYFRKIESNLFLIADEAHNMGANNIKKKLDNINVEKKIGLSATPKRVYDIAGTEAIDDFFLDKPPYTYNFPMERALKEGFLSEYIYHPIIVELNEIELENYISISQKLLKFFDFEKGHFKKNKIVEILLLKRKNIIHRAENKIFCFKSILRELKRDNNLKYIFTYIPEGYVHNIEDDGSEKILNKFIKAGAEEIPELNMNSYTSDDDGLKEIMRGFSEGKIDLLFAMKMLDEGVDIPRAEIGIFCSSTGNPRQFIQRRGRLLRNHKEKAHATIYDMVVIPPLNNHSNDHHNMERNMVKAELQRVAYFASLSMNYYDSRNNLVNVCSKYDLNLDQIIEEL